MHREISHTHDAFADERPYSLYLLTAFLGLLIFLDLEPRFAAWSGWEWLPRWSATLFGLEWALIAAVLGGARILYGSLEALFEGKLGADLALALATIAAILINENLVAAEVVFIGMLGECLESFTFARTKSAIHKMVEVCPRRCWLLRDGEEVRVLTSELQVGNRVVVKPGARVPVDGVVLEGRSAVDTSALTGEALPQDKGPGDEVLAGSLNQFGALTIEAQRVAEQTVVGRVLELTARALQNKAGLERTADRLARYFLPLVLGLALVTFLGALFLHSSAVFRAAESTAPSFMQAVRLSTYPALAVLVVACPCALILATPAAIIAALGRLAGTGVLIKGGAALERLASVSVVAFDKTGTLTEGRLQLGDVLPLAGIDARELLRLAATAEQRSEHLLAQLIVQQAQQEGLTLDAVAEFQAFPGAGVAAQTATHTLLVGNPRLFQEQGVPIAREVELLLDRLDEGGQTALLVAAERQILGVIGARDTVRPEAAQVLQELRDLGLDTLLLTGDRFAAAQSVARGVGIANVFAGLLPEQKADKVAELRGDGQRRVAMIGDGINDAPALARADVGIAIGSGADVAAEAGDVVMLGDPLKPLALLLRLSRATLRIIRQNIIWFAFVVNFVGIVLTAWLWPLFAPPTWYEQSPLAAVIYHQLGSLAVLLNSMRLLWFERSVQGTLLGDVRTRFRALDQWMEQRLSVDDGLHWLEHRWRPVSAAVVLLLLAGYALSGLTQIEADERAVVLRLGQPVAKLEPGLSWRWPWPIESSVRLKPDQLRTIQIGFRSKPGAQPSLAWDSPHLTDDYKRIPEESVMLTGDKNLVEVQASVRYRVVAPELYLFEINNPEEVVRAATEAVLRGQVASHSFGELLTLRRGRFQEEALAELRQRWHHYGRAAACIHFDGLSVHDLHPPQEVLDAYYEVSRAMENYDRLKNDAQASATKDRSDAAAKAASIRRLAAAARQEIVLQASADRDIFLAFSLARRQPGLAERWQLFSQDLEDVSSGMLPGLAEKLHAERLRQAAAQQTALTDFRLFWNALGRSLSGRDLVLLDAEKVPGRRHLLLLDPELLRSPLPLLQERPARAPAGESHGGP